MKKFLFVLVVLFSLAVTSAYVTNITINGDISKNVNIQDVEDGIRAAIDNVMPGVEVSIIWDFDDMAHLHIAANGISTSSDVEVVKAALVAYFGDILQNERIDVSIRCGYNEPEEID